MALMSRLLSLTLAWLCTCWPSIPVSAASQPTGGDGGAQAPSTCFHTPATIRGTPDGDRLVGTPRADVIVAGAGDDRVVGGGGDDLICAGRGEDLIHGGDGSDRLDGRAGVDRCGGGRGRDRLIHCERHARRHSAGPTDRPPTTTGSDSAPDGSPFATPPPPPQGEFSTDPELFPPFDPAIADYAIRCDGDQVDVSATAAPGSSIRVDGQAPREDTFEATVPLQSGQEFEVSLLRGTETRDYHVRCLPPDFPTWDFERLAQPSHRFYLVAPTLGAAAPPLAVVFDDHGVPVWWYRDALGATDARSLSDGSIAFSTHLGAEFGFATGPESAYHVRELDGSPAAGVSSAAGPGTIAAVGGPTDFHDLQELPNGNFLVISYQRREGVDLSSICAEGNPESCGSPDEHIYDGIIEEVDADGNLVRAWSSLEHLGVDEIAPQWRGVVLSRSPHDAFHLNAVEPDGDSLLVSSFFADAVYRIRWGDGPGSGEVVWKLGGLTTPKSLDVVGDPRGDYPLSAQHDVRRLADGTITIHDNHLTSKGGQGPRAVRYAIDEASRTATLLEEVVDPDNPHSGCCGSARRSDDGSWLISWGGNSLVTEFDAGGQRTFRLTFGGSLFSYRAVPAPAGALDIESLRAGMNAMHPR